MELKIVMKPVDEIIPYWRNPRRNDSVVGVLAEEIEKRGFNVPIVIDKNNVIVKGHARLRAAKRLGMKEVPCVISDAPDDVIRADRIADNKIQELSTWDFGKLEVELDKLDGKMAFGKLFRPDDGISQDDIEIEDIGYKPVGLSGGAFDFGDEPEYQSPSNPAYDFAPAEESHEHPDVPIYVDVPEMKAPDAKRTMKTLCPYCGKLVVVTL